MMFGVLIYSNNYTIQIRVQRASELEDVGTLVHLTCLYVYKPSSMESMEGDFCFHLYVQ